MIVVFWIFQFQFSLTLFCFLGGDPSALITAGISSTVISHRFFISLARCIEHIFLFPGHMYYFSISWDHFLLTLSVEGWQPISSCCVMCRLPSEISSPFCFSYHSRRYFQILIRNLIHNMKVKNLRLHYTGAFMETPSLRVPPGMA